jgi:chemotaxis protein methyltransferase CheR
MVSEGQPIDIAVTADAGAIPSKDAISIGLIVTELMINAIKYAFPMLRADAKVGVSYEVQGQDWKLVVSDNGIGKQDNAAGATIAGLGTAIVQALVRQLEAKVDIISSPNGMSVSITHATFTSRLPLAS